jgi:hypothetical protein
MKIGDMIFNTAQDCHKYTQYLLESFKIGKLYNNDPNFNYFINLVNNHYNKDTKIGCGIKYFIIGKNKLKQNQPHNRTLTIIRLDNSKEEISWRKCCGIEQQKCNSEFKLSHTMRNAVSYFTTKFKTSNKLICNICFKTTAELNYYNFTTDHYPISFNTIKNDFLKKCLTDGILHPTQFNKCSITNLSMFMIEDDKFKNDWIEYHNSVANYQLLCDICHCKKDRPNYIKC